MNRYTVKYENILYKYIYKHSHTFSVGKTDWHLFSFLLAGLHFSWSMSCLFLYFSFTHCIWIYISFLFISAC